MHKLGLIRTRRDLKRSTLTTFVADAELEILSFCLACNRSNSRKLLANMKAQYFVNILDKEENKKDLREERLEAEEILVHFLTSRGVF